jgi:hypothetical protein
LEDAKPGLIARIVLPCAEGATPPTGKAADVLPLETQV